MIAAFALAASLVCQTGPQIGQPGVIGYPGQDPVIARAASMAYRQYQHVDTAARVDFAPMGGLWITPSKVWPQLYGADYNDRFVSPFGQGISPGPPYPSSWTAARGNGVYVNAHGQQLLPYPQPASMTGPPYFGVRNPIPMGF